MDSQNEQAGGKIVLDKIQTYVVLTLLFLLPIFFIPAFSVSFIFSKTILFWVGTIAVFALWIVARLRDGRFLLPRNAWLYLSAAAIVLVYLVSSFFSQSPFTSLIGQGFEIDTFAFVLAGFLLMTMVGFIFRTKDSIFYAYTALLLSFFILALYQLLRLMIGPEFLSFTIFTGNTSNLLGKWNDLAVFFGLTAILSLTTLELVMLRKGIKAILYVALALSLLFLAVINFGYTWYVLGLFSLVFFVYVIASSSNGLGSSNTFSNRRISYVALGVLIISIIFILSGQSINNFLSSYFGVSQVEARPSLAATYDLARSALKKNALLGVGPNRFSSEWAGAKPRDVNETVFWNSEFSYGFGLIPSVPVTAGILGLLAWISFLAAFGYTGFKALFAKVSDKFEHYLIISSFLGSLYLWIFAIIYVPSTVTYGLSFLMTGLFIGSLAQAKLLRENTVAFSDNPKESFVGVLVLVLLFIGSVTSGYYMLQKFASHTYFQKSAIAATIEGDLGKAETYIDRALALSKSDVYYRHAVDLNIARMGVVLSQQNVSQDLLTTQFSSVLGVALENANAAISLDETNYQNWLARGRIYESVIPLQIPGAYESAEKDYQKALDMNPMHPQLYLVMARLEIVNRNNAKAREFIAKAIERKRNYTEAIFLLSQIEASEGRINEAIASVETAAAISPNNAEVFFQLGLLKYNNKDYRGATSALERAVTINGSYSNAKYFLGLSYSKLGDNPKATAQFADLKVLNPGNQEVELILTNLQAGRDPFANAKPPVDDKPEKRSTLPIEEDDAPTEDQ